MDKISKNIQATTVKQILKERRKIFNGALSKHARSWQRKEMVRGTLFTLPMIGWSLFFMIATVGVAFWLTTKYGSMRLYTEYGTKNWQLLKDDVLLKPAIMNSLKITSLTASVGLGMALIVATILNTKKTYGKNFFMTLLFLPQVTSVIASTFIFVNILGPNGIFGIDFNKERAKVLWVIIFQNTWLQASGAVVIYNTAFTTIDRAQYEVADIDGAGPIKQFYKLTIPSLSNILIYSIFTSLVGGLAIFAAPFVLKGYFDRIDPLLVNTWASYGYSYMLNIGSTAEHAQNIGYGMVVLITLSATIIVITFIINKIQPITKRRN